MASRFLLALLATLVCADAARAEANIFPSRNTLAAALKEADCSRTVDQGLKELTIHKLDGGHTLVFLSCWLGPCQASDLAILTGPSTKNEPRVLVFHEWIDGKFEPTLAVMMAEYDPKTKRSPATTRAAARATAAAPANGRGPATSSG